MLYVKLCHWKTHLRRFDNSLVRISLCAIAWLDPGSSIVKLCHWKTHLRRFDNSLVRIGLCAIAWLDPGSSIVRVSI